MGRLVDYSGQVFGEWTVTANHKPHYFGKNGMVTLWECICSCGNKSWLRPQALYDGRSKCCRGEAHRSFVVGQQVGDMVITKITPRNKNTGGAWRNTYEVKCICGRTRTFDSVCPFYETRKPRLTCGCNGMDWLYVRGDLNFPKGVNDFHGLARWAGCTHQRWYQIVKAEGLTRALEWLTQKAEAIHPGEGWRIKAIIPDSLSVQPPHKVLKKRGRKRKYCQAWRCKNLFVNDLLLCEAHAQEFVPLFGANATAQLAKDYFKKGERHE